MNYIYIPDSFDYNLVHSKFTDDEFLSLQIKYRAIIEKILKDYIDFEDIDKRINNNVVLPKIEDLDYNFYHKFSSLNSNYLYLRNNIHIENLSMDQIEKLKNDKADKSFIVSTLGKVLFEDGDMACYGSPRFENIVNCKGFIFEFAYDSFKINSLSDLIKIDKMIEEIKVYLKDVIENIFRLPTSIVVYKSLSNIYSLNENDIVD